MIMPALRRLAVPAMATLLLEALLIALGVWQLRRLAWKEGLIARVEARASAAPRALPPPNAWSSMKPADEEFAHVAVDGTFDHAAETLILRASAEGPVYHVITPLHLASGGTVLVDRGAVPADRRAQASREAGEVAGLVRVTGLLRAPEPRNAFTPVDVDGTFYTRDPVAIAAYHHLADAAPFSIDADPAIVNPGGLPKPGGAELTLPNNHLSYALTWFGLAVALAGVFAAYAAKGFARSGAAEKPAMDDADKRARGRPAIIENTP